MHATPAAASFCGFCQRSIITAATTTSTITTRTSTNVIGRFARRSTPRSLSTHTAYTKHSLSGSSPLRITAARYHLRKDSSLSLNVQKLQQPRRTMASATAFYDFKPLNKKGEPFPLADYKGKVVLVVNTASKCGATPQYAALQSLYEKFQISHPGQFVVLGFPCNQFAGQDPGTNDEIQSFCQVNYGVTFPVLGKIDVNGDKADPLFEWLKNEKAGLLGLKRVKWNFEKWLVGRDGSVKGRWATPTKPESLEGDILAALSEKTAEGEAKPEVKV